MLFKLSRNTYSVYSIPKFLSEEECDLLSNFDWNKLDNDEYLNQHSWFIDKLSDFIMQANQFYYLFDLQVISDFQVKEYTSKDFPSSNLFECDINPSNLATSIRKLSIVIFLSRSIDYKGGTFIFRPTGERFIQERGSIIIFPSFRQYTITPVTQGNLRLIHGWSYGAPFK